MRNRFLAGCLSGAVLCGAAVSMSPFGNDAALAPERPSGVPAGAYWAGGADGGNFYDCRFEAGAMSCTIYDDRSGRRSFEGRFELTDWEQLKYRDVAAFYADINAFDGRQLHLAARSFKSPLAPKKQK